MPRERTQLKLIKPESVSRTTYWRARRRGWACVGYRKREVLTSDKVDAALVIESARIGAAKAYRALNVVSLSPFTFDDLVSQACLRLLELAGHKAFNERGFRINAAFNAARAFIRVHVYNKSVKHARTASERKSHELHKNRATKNAEHTPRFVRHKRGSCRVD